MKRNTLSTYHNHLSLIRKITWSFHNSTGIEWDELFGEAVLCYWEAALSHNPEKAKLTTWTTTCITNRLRTFCKKQNALSSRRKNNKPIPQTHSENFFDVHQSAVFHEMINNSSSTQQIFELIMKEPHQYIGWGGKGKIKEQLRELGWTWEKIWNGFREMKQLLNKTKAHSV